jgi:hypothetical protein
MTSLSENTVVTTSGGLVELASTTFDGMTINGTGVDSTASSFSSPITLTFVSDGSPIVVEWFAREQIAAGVGTTTSGESYVVLFLNGVFQQRLTRVQTYTTFNVAQSSASHLRLTPAAGVHTIEFKQFRTNGNGSIGPGYARVSKVVQASQFIVPLASAPLVTSIPSAPIDGQEIRYLADATNGVIWNLRYDGQGTYPWKFIGGAPLVAAVAAGSATTSTSYVALSGPTLTLALAGDYDISASFSASFNGSASGAMGVQIASGSDEDYAWGITEAPGFNTTHVGTYRKTVTAASSVLTSKVKSPQGSNVTFSERVLRVTPVRVKAP